MPDDDYGFGDIPLADTALAGQNLDLLTTDERSAIEVYAHNGFEFINPAMRGRIPMTSAVARRIALIRSGLAKFPIPVTVRVSREVDAALCGITDEISAQSLIDEKFTEPAFLSTSGLADPPRDLRRTDPAVLELILPAGTPALRLGALAAVPAGREVC
ncbi:ADP-ribosyltransferase [Nocardia sp. CA-151230]|uniref:ADP-ribosyltransferase n=1 Tax=Nocardia sp. CA-151230 TaxID=3239982 RepID=UPI003D90F829